MFIFGLGRVVICAFRAWLHGRRTSTSLIALFCQLFVSLRLQPLLTLFMALGPHWKWKMVCPSPTQPLFSAHIQMWFWINESLILSQVTLCGVKSKKPSLSLQALISVRRAGGPINHPDRWIKCLSRNVHGVFVRVERKKLNWAWQ